MRFRITAVWIAVACLFSSSVLSAPTPAGLNVASQPGDQEEVVDRRAGPFSDGDGEQGASGGIGGLFPGHARSLNERGTPFGDHHESSGGGNLKEMFPGHHRRSVEKRAGVFADGDGEQEASGGIGDLFPGHARSVEERDLPKMGGPDPGAPKGRTAPFQSGGHHRRSVEKRTGAFADGDGEQGSPGGIGDLFPGHARSVEERGLPKMPGHDPGAPTGRPEPFDHHRRSVEKRAGPFARGDSEQGASGGIGDLFPGHARSLNERDTPFGGHHESSGGSNLGGMFAGHHRRSVEERAGPFAGGDGTSGGIGDLFPGHARSVEERGMPKMGGPDPGAPGGRGGPWHRSVEKRSSLFAGSNVEQRASGGIEDLFPGHARSVEERGMPKMGGPDPGAPGGRGGPWHRSVEKRSGLFAGSDVEQRASGGIEDLFPGHARSVDKRKTDMEGDPGSPKGRGGAGKYFAGDKRDIPNVPGGDRPHGGKDPKVKGMFGQ